MKTKTKPFKHLTAVQKRVAIARDAIKCISAKRFKIQTGDWFRFVNSDGEIDQTSLQSPRLKCTCCAVGAAMAASVRLFNECEITASYANTKEAHDQTKKFFPIKQLELVEVAFERGKGYFGSHNPDSKSKLADKGRERIAAISFGKRFRKNKERALAIFRNIIRNKGTFKP